MPAPFPPSTGKPPLWYRFVSIIQGSDSTGTEIEGGTALKDCTVMVVKPAETTNKFPDGSPVISTLIPRRYKDKPRATEWKTLSTIKEIDLLDYHRDLRQKWLYANNYRESPDYSPGPPPTGTPGSKQDFKLKVTIKKKLLISGIVWNPHYIDNIPFALEPPGFDLQWAWNMPAGDAGTKSRLKSNPTSGGLFSTPVSNGPFGAITSRVTSGAGIAGRDRSYPSPATFPGDYMGAVDKYIRNDLWGTTGVLGFTEFIFTPQHGVYSEVWWAAKQAPNVRTQFEEFRDRVGRIGYWLKPDGTVALTSSAGATFVPAKDMSQNYKDRLTVTVVDNVEIPVKAAIAINYRSAVADSLVREGDAAPPEIFYGVGRPPLDSLGKTGDYYINLLAGYWYGPKLAVADFSGSMWGTQKTSEFPQSVRKAALTRKNKTQQVYSAIWYDQSPLQPAFFFEGDSRAVTAMFTSPENTEIPLFIPLDPESNNGFSGRLTYYKKRDGDFRILENMGANSAWLTTNGPETLIDGDSKYEVYRYSKDSIPGWGIGIYLPADGNFPIGGAGGEDKYTDPPDQNIPINAWPPTRENPVVLTSDNYTAGSGIYYYPYVDNEARGRPIFDQKTIPWIDWRGTSYQGKATRYVTGYYYEVSLSGPNLGGYLGGQPYALVPRVIAP